MLYLGLIVAALVLIAIVAPLIARGNGNDEGKKD